MAIKVKRPNLHEDFSHGLQDSIASCQILEAFGVQGSANIKSMLQEVRPVVLLETDFLNEAKNAEQFQRAMKSVPWVRVPKIIEATSDSLVMEFIKGTKIDEVQESDSPVSLAVLAIRLSACFMLQLIRAGRFHGGCHSGNISVTETGDFVFYDLGAVIQLADSPRKYFDSMISAFIKNDAELALECLAGIGVLDLSNCTDEGDKRMLLRSIETIMSHVKRFDTNTNVHELLQDQKILGRNKRPVFKPTSESIYLLRNAGMIDALCRRLDPTFEPFDLLMNVLPGDKLDFGMMRQLATGLAEDVQSIRGIPKLMEDLVADTQENNRRLRLGQRAIGVWVATLTLFMCLSEIL